MENGTFVASEFGNAESRFAIGAISSCERVRAGAVAPIIGGGGVWNNGAAAVYCTSFCSSVSLLPCPIAA
eukprot:4494068-Pleurochrysis_carterae.AAC.2